MVARLSSWNGDMSLLNRVGSHVCFSALFVGILVVCQSPLHSVHNLATHLQLPSSFTLVGPLVPYKSCKSHFMCRCRTCVD